MIFAVTFVVFCVSFILGMLWGRWYFPRTVEHADDETLLLDALDNYDIAYNRARDGRWDQADRYRDEARRLRALREIEKAR